MVWPVTVLQCEGFLVKRSPTSNSILYLEEEEKTKDGVS